MKYLGYASTRKKQAWKIGLKMPPPQDILRRRTVGGLAKKAGKTGVARLRSYSCTFRRRIQGRFARENQDPKAPNRAAHLLTFPSWIFSQNTLTPPGE